MNLSQRTVARLLGHPNTVMLSRYECSRSIPPLVVAFRLEIVYRVPVAFLFPGMYEALRNEIRAREEKVSGLDQPTSEH